MSDLSNYEERQEDEVEFLQSFFPNPGDFQDLRQKDTWKVIGVLNPQLTVLSMFKN